MAAHVTGVKLPAAQVADPEPVKPASQVTVTDWPVVPDTLLRAALFEWATSVAVQESAVHVMVLKLPPEPQVVLPLPEKPVSQVTVTDWPVVPVMLSVVA